MSKLTNEQKLFLQDQKIPLSEMFDASGMSRGEYSERMKQLDKSFAYNVTPCSKAGHTLRSRAGSCIQCSPAAIAFQIRGKKAGYVYIAGSKKIKVLKVGTTSDCNARKKSLNGLGYAGAQDWDILAYAEINKAGSIEFAIHKQLEVYAHPTSYQRDGYQVECLETFKCPVSVMLPIYKQLVEEQAEAKIWINDIELNKYEFEMQTGLNFNRKGNTNPRLQSTITEHNKKVQPKQNDLIKDRNQVKVLNNNNTSESHSTTTIVHKNWIQKFFDKLRSFFDDKRQ